ncbi:dihydroxyacetone kinase phosphoryl donor subunit DhaM [Streptococcus agalactiae]|uniref:dihydroxyacetone kinase phosphoryl donor subunit DhaM n=2 Tax=Streptococcus agalactiae TaxID=1311 RepID=UPI00067C225B|nr:dihydroxyacetone kinase phosphoryl donor subunit DhaM [Streptococcus agalactiae]
MTRSWRCLKSDIGIIVVSHSKNIAQGVVDLISEVAKDVSITYVGGTEDGEIGTSFDQVQQIVEQNDKKTLLAFFDLGSAKMNLELVADFSEKNIIINSVPVVEGAYTAAALLQAGADLDSIQSQLAELTINK